MDIKRIKSIVTAVAVQTDGMYEVIKHEGVDKEMMGEYYELMMFLMEAQYKKWGDVNNGCYSLKTKLEVLS